MIIYKKDHQEVASSWLAPGFAMTTIDEINEKWWGDWLSPIAPPSPTSLITAIVIANEVKQPHSTFFAFIIITKPKAELTLNLLTQKSYNSIQIII
jgi:hypothetical protein